MRRLDVKDTVEAVVLIGEGTCATQALEKLLMTAVHHVLSVESYRASPHFASQGDCST